MSEKKQNFPYNFNFSRKQLDAISKGIKVKEVKMLLYNQVEYLENKDWYSKQYAIRMYNDRKKEMLYIPDRDLEQIFDFIKSMRDSDQDYGISNKENLIKVDKKDLEAFEDCFGYL